MRRDVEAQSRISQPDQSERAAHTGRGAVAGLVGAPAGQEGAMGGVGAARKDGFLKQANC